MSLGGGRAFGSFSTGSKLVEFISLDTVPPASTINVAARSSVVTGNRTTYSTEQEKPSSVKDANEYFNSEMQG